MKQLNYLLFIISLLPGFGLCQGQVIIVENAEEIQADRYKDIKGSPYLFEDWAVATLVGTRGEETKDIRINYNGYEKEFEVLVQGKHITLDTRPFKRILITTPTQEGQELLFQRGFHRDYSHRFANIIYNGQELKLIREYVINLSKKKVENVGKTVEFERFVPDNKYYIWEKSELIPIKLRKKDLFKVLGRKTELDSYIKEHNLKLASHQDLHALFAYYETLQ